MKRRRRPGRRAFLHPNSDAVSMEDTDALDEERALGEVELQSEIRAIQAGTMMNCLASRRAGI